MSDLATMAMEQLLESKRKADELLAKIQKLAKSEPRKAKYPTSPYAKFDKYHKRKRK